MSKISKKEYLDNIRNIINEGMSEDRELKSNKFNISRHIAALIESGQNDPQLMNYLMSWHEQLKQMPSEKEFTVYESFAQGLAKYQKGNPEVKSVLKEMQVKLGNYGDEYVIFNLIEQLHDPVLQEAARETYNDYLYEATQENRKEVIEAVWPEVESNNPVALKLIEAISNEDSIRNRELQIVNESNGYDAISERVAQVREERKIKRTQEMLENYAKEVFEKARADKEAEKAKYNFSTVINNNGINLRKAIRTITESDASSNKKLMGIIEQYAGALNNGLYEERLYETFLHKMAAFDYLQPVEKAVKAINEAVKKNAVSIELTKLLEEMAESTSAYILPLIEEDCARFIKNPNPTNRVQVRNCLVAYASDPYCYKILETIESDNSLATHTIAEKALDVKDAINLIREHAAVKDLYSPVQYIKEGESVFYTNGQYFVRKGKTIAKLSQDGISQLSEKFTTLCKLVNDPNVEIYEDYILLTGADKVARIYEGFVDINGIRESSSTLRNLQEMCMKYDYDTNFFIMASCLHENFNKIAKINFAKHVYLKENAGLNVDIFRIGENIFVNAVNEDANVSTFFHNVNPIQCRNIINNHMGLNVSNLFEALLPNQSKILLKLNEQKEEYQKEIDKVEDTIARIKDAQEKSTDEATLKKLADGLEKAEATLKDLKADYKAFQKKAADATGEDVEDEEEFDDEEVNGDGEVKKETTNEPLNDDDVEKAMDDLTTPIENGDNTTEGEDVDTEGDDLNLTDDEFESFLDGENTEEVIDDEDVDVDDIEVEDKIVTDEPEVEDTEDVVDDEVDDEVSVEDTETEEPTEFDNKLDNEINAIINDEIDDIEDDDTEVTDDEKIFSADEDEVSVEEPVEDDEVLATDEIEPVESGDEDELGFEEINIDDETEEDTEEVVDDSDEDIIIDDIEVDEPEEVPSDEEIADAPTEEFGGKIGEEVIDMTDNADDDIPVQIQDINTDTELIAKITNVLFDENIKTGVKYRTGTVNAIVPMVDKSGRMYNDNQTYTFYLDEEGTPVIDNEEMPYSLYSAIVNKIKAEPSYATFKEEGVENTEKATSADSYVNITKDVMKDEAPEEVNVIEFNDDDDVEFFNTKDTETEFSITPKDDFADIPEINFEELDFEDDDEEMPEDDKISAAIKAIPTYTEGETEIELPAANIDDTIIPEKVNVKVKAKKINENRKAIKGIGSVLTSNKGTRFFVNEDTAKSSKSLNRYGRRLYNEKVSGTADNNNGLILENHGYNPELRGLHATARMLSKNTGINISRIFDIAEYYIEGLELEFFNIVDGLEPDNSYTVYMLNNTPYYRPTEEFVGCIKDTEDEVPGQLEALLTVTYDTDEDLIPIDLAEAKNVINGIINSLLGRASELNEHAKIRKTKLSTDHNVMNSKMVDDILHGDKEQRDFEEKIEKDTQANGIENPLAPSSGEATDEAVKPKLPNVHRMSLDEARNFEIIYEPNDRVLYKNEKAEVISIQEDGKADIKVNGKTITVAPKDLEPDPDYVNDLEVDDSDEKKSLNKDDKNANLNDLNKKTIDCNIVIDGQRMNMHECYAILDDIKDGKKQIRVINEYGDITEVNTENIDFTEWPYAVIVNSEGEPIRKIQINPQSYINAAEDDYVECLVADKPSKYIKRVINVLS